MGLLKDKTGEWKTGYILVFSLIIVLTFWAGTFIVLYFADKPGQIGDSFGMVNALFSALAFSLLIYTSLLQTQELKLQREELRENRKQLESSAKAHNELVELNKIIHSDKVIPQFKIIDFEETNDEVLFYLKTLFGDINLHRLENSFKKDYKGSFGYGYPPGTIDGLHMEGKRIGPINIDKSKIHGLQSLKLLYLDGKERKFYQEVKNLNSRWILDSPKEVKEGSKVTFYN